MKTQPLGWAMSGLALATMMASLDTSLANSGLPILKRALSASFAEVQWVVLAYLLTMTALVVSVGRLGDLFGRRRMLLAGIALFTVSSVACAFAASIAFIVVARAIQGVGGATMIALSLAFVSEIVPKEKVGRAMGLVGTMSAVGTALGAPLGGLLAANLGWRSMFLVSVPTGIAALILVSKFVPADKKPTSAGRRFDGLGTLLLGGSLTAYALAMTLGKGTFGPLNYGLLAMTAVGVFVLVRHLSRAPYPVIPLETFCNRSRTKSLVAGLFVAAVMMSTLVVGPFYLTRGLGLGPAAMGLVLAAGPLVVILSGVPAGRLAERFGADRVSFIGLSGMILAAGMLSLSTPAMGIPSYVVPIALLTAGYSLFQTSNNTLVMAGVAPEERGVVSGMLGLSRNLGLITGASAMGAVFRIASGAGDSDAVSYGMRITFGVAIAILVVAFLVLRFGKSYPLPRRCRPVASAAN